MILSLNKMQLNSLKSLIKQYKALPRAWGFPKNHFIAGGKDIEALTEEQKRIKNLEVKLKDVEMKRDILKKAVGIFSRVSK